MTTRATGRSLCLALAFACVAGAAPARAEFPVAVRADVGVGIGSARSNGAGLAGPAAIGAVDLLWRVRPTWTPLLGARIGGVDACLGCSEPAVYPSPYPDATRPSISDATFTSFVAGVAWRRPAGVTPWLSGGLGVGRFEPDGRRQETVTGLALDAALGLQLAPDPGPLGFVVTLRNHHVLAPFEHAQAVTLGVGLTVYPR